MRSGRVARHRMRIEQLSAGSPRQSSSGMRADAWATFATVRAGVKVLAGRALESAQQRNAAIANEIEIRYLAGVEAEMRGVIDGTVYTFVDVRPDPRKRYMLIDASSGIVNDQATTQ